MSLIVLMAFMVSSLKRISPFPGGQPPRSTSCRLMHSINVDAAALLLCPPKLLHVWIGVYGCLNHDFFAL